MVTYIILTLDSELSTVKIYSERRTTMNVKKVGEKYRCNICGNEVTVTKAGGGELVCCGEPMEKI
jgi:desulfoferrodoxin-like iron-binding protein